jgi:hypothetical protein
MLETPEAVRIAHLEILKEELTRRGIDSEFAAVEPYQAKLGIQTFDPADYHIGGSGEDIQALRVKTSIDGFCLQVVAIKYDAPSDSHARNSGYTDYTLTGNGGNLAYEVTVLEERPGKPWTAPTKRLKAELMQSIVWFIQDAHNYVEKYSVPVKLPAPAKHAARLKAVADGKLSSNISVVRTVDSFFVGNMPNSEQAVLQADLDALSDAALIWHFPRDDKGRLERGKIIMLATYPTCLEGKYQPKAVWLTAEGPARVTDQVVTLAMKNTTGENFDHQWWQERWMWDTRAHRGDLYHAWEIEDKEKAKRCYDFLIKGMIIEAFNLYETELDPQLQRLLQGKPTDYAQSEFTKVWAPRLLENLMKCAPWRFALLLAREKQAREAWVKLKPSRKYEAKPIALFGLGGVSAPDRPQIFLTAKGGGRMQLFMDWSGTQISAANTDWMRPLDFDLLQSGLITEDCVP